MTTEQLSKGKALDSEIYNLEQHLIKIKPDSKYNDLPLTVNYFSPSYRDEVNLKKDFLNMKEFLIIYQIRVQMQIDALKKELEAL